MALGKLGFPMGRIAENQNYQPNFDGRQIPKSICGHID
jgi:hypothetical protein